MTVFEPIYKVKDEDDDVLQVEIKHLGNYKFKGVAGAQVVMQINSSGFSERRFPPKASSAKAEQVCPCPAPSE